jgi:hypothetical protein
MTASQQRHQPLRYKRLAFGTGEGWAENEEKLQDCAMQVGGAAKVDKVPGLAL